MSISRAYLLTLPDPPAAISFCAKAANAALAPPAGAWAPPVIEEKERKREGQSLGEELCRCRYLELDRREIKDIVFFTHDNEQ